METIFGLIQLIAELLKIGAQYLPEVFKYLELAYELLSGKQSITPEILKQIEDAHRDVLKRLDQAIADREAEAAAMQPNA